MGTDRSKHAFWRLWLGRLLFLLPRAPVQGGDLHFVRSYRRLVRRLKADYRHDAVMDLVVGGGGYDRIGARLAEVVASAADLSGRVSLLDLGCGSGRLPAALQARAELDYLGVDILPELLAHARSQCPPHYRFVLNRGFTIPAADRQFDVACAFSLFTHLKHEETYAYLAEVRRVLRPGGVLVMSFLEFTEPSAWTIFDQTLDGLLRRRPGIANVFIERSALTVWAERLGFEPPRFVSPSDPGPVSELGQSVAVLRTPNASA